MAQLVPGVGAEEQTFGVEVAARVGEVAVGAHADAAVPAEEVVADDREIFLLVERNTDHPHLTLHLAGVAQEA